MNKLIEEVRKFREAFVIAVGDKSPFAKQALGRLDSALEEAEQLPLIMDEEQTEKFINAARALYTEPYPVRVMTAPRVTSGEDILDPIREAVYNVKKEGFDVVKIHITQDFKMRVRAKVRPMNRSEAMTEMILGYPVVVHEEADVDWWIEDTSLGRRQRERAK